MAKVTWDTLYKHMYMRSIVFQYLFMSHALAAFFYFCPPLFPYLRAVACYQQLVAGFTTKKRTKVTTFLGCCFMGTVTCMHIAHAHKTHCDAKSLATRGEKNFATWFLDLGNHGNSVILLTGAAIFALPDSIGGAGL